MDFGNHSGIPTRPREAISQQAAPRRQLNPEELNNIKPIIKTLYIDKGLTFREVQTVLHAKHNYKPT